MSQLAAHLETPPTTEVMLSVNDLKVSFPTDDGLVEAVRGVSYEVNRGEVFAIVGESGCGKSVSTMALMGLLPKTARIEGHATYLDQDLLGIPERDARSIRGSRVSMIFQDPMTSLNPVYTIGRQLAEAVLAHHRVAPKVAMERAIEMLDVVGIPQAKTRAKSYPHEFSGGMRQRVMIAMAIINDPDVIIADEPTTALDVTVQAQILETLLEAKEKVGASIVLITHDLGVVAGVADRVGVMYAGRFVEMGDVNEIFHATRMPYTAGLLGSIPDLDSDVEALTPIEGSPPSLINPAPGCKFRARCPMARARCAEEEPALAATDRPGHTAACFFSDELIGDPNASEIFKPEWTERTVQ
ncbi:ABC transporter ATP-binding protein [Ilumatobacter nonamiensis]|uniref:ABC transporter ATP-binding protein n=1 Tax=Ilumatobacter nonamiensis TaxID=467093 RepID=UPI00034522B2|nr:ABC transporter ATP-binding protein [Ilumatobacter nonamiensis]